MSPERQSSAERIELESVRMLETPPELVVLSRDLYPEDTLGRTHFPEMLEGRTRPASFADVSFYPGPKSHNHLQSMGVSTLADVFRMTVADFEAVPPKFRHLVEGQLKSRVNRLTESQAYTPHGRLVGAIYGDYQGGPIDPTDEPELITIVNDTVDSLPDLRDRFIIQSRFGLVDWQPNTLEEVAEKAGLTRERIRQLESKALSKLRHPQRPNYERLQQFRTLPTFSVGRQVMNLTYRRELPELPVNLDDLPLSKKSRKDLVSAGDIPMRYMVGDEADERIASRKRKDAQGLAWRLDDFERFLSTRLHRPLADDTVQELSTELPRAMRREAAYLVLGDLLPEFEVDEPDLIGEIALRNFGIRDRTESELRGKGIRTLGQLTGVKSSDRANLDIVDPYHLQKAALHAGMVALYLGEIVDKI